MIPADLAARGLFPAEPIIGNSQTRAVTVTVHFISSAMQRSHVQHKKRTVMSNVKVLA